MYVDFDEMYGEKSVQLKWILFYTFLFYHFGHQIPNLFKRVPNVNSMQIFTVNDRVTIANPLVTIRLRWKQRKNLFYNKREHQANNERF